MSEAGRLFSFIRPEAAMRDIVARPSCAVPLTVGLLAALAYSAVVLPRAAWASAATMTAAGTLAGALFRIFLMAGLVTVLAALFQGASVSFKQVLAVVCYARIPGVLFLVLAMLLILLRRASGLADSRPVNPMLTNLAVFLDPHTTSRFVYSLASSVDCVFFWELALIAVGLKATSQISSRAAAMTIVTYWFVYSLGFAAWMQWFAFAR
jgi:hypothetical protein